MFDRDAAERLLWSRVQDVPDWPQPGILFRDLTPLLADPVTFATAVDLVAVQIGRARHAGPVVEQRQRHVSSVHVAITVEIGGARGGQQRAAKFERKLEGPAFAASCNETFASLEPHARARGISIKRVQLSCVVAAHAGARRHQRREHVVRRRCRTQARPLDPVAASRQATAVRQVIQRHRVGKHRPHRAGARGALAMAHEHAGAWRQQQVGCQHRLGQRCGRTRRAGAEGGFGPQVHLHLRHRGGGLRGLEGIHRERVQIPALRRHREVLGHGGAGGHRLGDAGGGVHEGAARHREAVAFADGQARDGAGSAGGLRDEGAVAVQGVGIRRQRHGTQRHHREQFLEHACDSLQDEGGSSSDAGQPKAGDGT